MAEAGCAPSQPQGQLLGLGLGMAVGARAGAGEMLILGCREVKSLVQSQETLASVQL